MAQKMDEQIDAGLALADELSKILEKVEAIIGPSKDWNKVDPLKLIHTIIKGIIYITPHAITQP